MTRSPHVSLQRTSVAIESDTRALRANVLRVFALHASVNCPVNARHGLALITEPRVMGLGLNNHPFVKDPIYPPISSHLFESGQETTADGGFRFEQHTSGSFNL